MIIYLSVNIKIVIIALHYLDTSHTHTYLHHINIHVYTQGRKFFPPCPPPENAQGGDVPYSHPVSALLCTYTCMYIFFLDMSEKSLSLHFPQNAKFENGAQGRYSYDSDYLFKGGGGVKLKLQIVCFYFIYCREGHFEKCIYQLKSNS